MLTVLVLGTSCHGVHREGSLLNEARCPERFSTGDTLCLPRGSRAQLDSPTLSQLWLQLPNCNEVGPPNLTRSRTFTLRFFLEL